MHHVLVHPGYQGRDIAGTLVELAKEKYKDYLYIGIMPEESKNAAFNEKHGFRRMDVRGNAALYFFGSGLGGMQPGGCAGLPFPWRKPLCGLGCGGSGTGSNKAALYGRLVYAA